MRVRVGRSANRQGVEGFPVERAESGGSVFRQRA